MPVAVSARTDRLAVLFAGGLALALIAFNLWLLVTWAPVESRGQDFGIYQTVAHRFLDGGGLYGANQLAGPYVVAPGDSLYPPPVLLLILPATVLPAFAWWLVPTVIVAAVLWRLHPSRWAIVAMLWLLAYPPSMALLWTGNPIMWCVAAMALAAVWRPAAVFVLLKPTLAPLALFGARDLRWWLLLALCGVLSLALLPLWREYLTALLNARGPRTDVVFYLSNVPLVLIPLAAFAGRTKPAPAEARAGMVPGAVEA